MPLPADLEIKDANGVTRTVKAPLTPGRAAAAESRPVALSTEDAAFLDNIEAKLDTVISSLTTIDGRVDGLETLVTATNTALGTANGTLTTIDASLNDIEAAAEDVTTPSPVKIDQTTPGTTNGVVASVRQPSDVVPFTPTLDTAAYASGDVLWATALISGIARANDERALLQSLTVVDKSDQKPAFTAFFFKTNVASGAFNGAPSISDADAANYLGHTSVAAADYKDLGGVSVACIKGINLLLEAVSGGTGVYCFAVLDAGTPTFANGDLVLGLGVVQS